MPYLAKVESKGSHVTAWSVPASSSDTHTHYTLPCAQSVPGGVNVRIEVLLSGLASADAVARVIIGEDVAVDASAEADVEAAHLAEVHCISVGEQNGEPEDTAGRGSNQ